MVMAYWVMKMTFFEGQSNEILLTFKAIYMHVNCSEEKKPPKLFTSVLVKPVSKKLANVFDLMGKLDFYQP